MAKSGDRLYASARFRIKEAAKTHTPPCFYKNRLYLSINIGVFKILGGSIFKALLSNKTVADKIITTVSPSTDAAILMTKTYAAIAATNCTILIAQKNIHKKRDEFLHPFFNA
ncbi:hypothetical protein KDM87_11495 [Undibacterium sp. FT147W]|uniref:Uncharacterized protein n=1 Tax=Undibacterium rivi TaxID=2828729 RepID=A0ABS5H3C8_9BURK|nr:hypothetical protein [Undibacterium rivi]MBR7793225.1 hypothetical protein [Undibacterium rivi]